MAESVINEPFQQGAQLMPAEGVLTVSGTDDLTSAANVLTPPTGGMFRVDPEVILSETVLNIYQGMRAEWAQQSRDDEDFRNGVQWTTKQKAELKRLKQAPLVVNVIQPAVEQAKAALTANPPKFSSTGREGSDIKVGAMFSDLMSYIWDHSLGDVEHKQVVDNYYVRGMGVWCAYQDPYADNGKGEVYIKALDPWWVYFDPNSQDIFCRDAAHIIISRVLTLEQIWNTYPKIAPTIRDFGMQAVADQRTPTQTLSPSEGQINIRDVYHRKYEIIDRYTKVQVQRIHLYEPLSGTEKVLTGDEYREFLGKPAFVEITNNAAPRFIVADRQIPQAQAIYQETGGTFHYAVDPNDPDGTPKMQPGDEQAGAAADQQAGLQTIPSSTVKLEQMTMKDMIELKVFVVNEIYVTRIKRIFSIGRVLVFMGELPIEHYPIIPVMNRHMRNPYPMSDVRFVRPLQEYVNKIRSLIVAHAANSTSLKLLIPRGSANRNELIEEWQKAGTGVIEYDAELGTATVAGPVPLPNELYQNERAARSDIQEILGVYALAQGDSAQAPSTYKGTIALDEFAQRRIKSKRDDIEQALNQLGRVVIQLIQKTYTEPKAIRLLRPNNTPLEFAINQPVYDDLSQQVVGVLNDITVGDYDMVVVSGSTLPNNRWARFEYYLQLYKEGIIDQYEVLKQTEVIDIEGVMKRMNQINQLKQQLAAAMDQIKGLKGDLQTASRESVHAQKQVEVQKFKTNLAETTAKLDAAATTFSSRLNDERANYKRLVAERTKQARAKQPQKKR